MPPQFRFIFLLFFILLFGCTTTIVYNPKEFDTKNYQKNVDNAVNAADIFIDFDETKAPKVEFSPQYFSLLLQADLLYNQGNYADAYAIYDVVITKYKDPRIIYKAIICLEHIATTKKQKDRLNKLVNELVAISPNSQLSKLFQIEMALNNNDLDLAKDNLDFLIDTNPQNGRLVLLFMSSIITNGLKTTKPQTLIDFAEYVTSKYYVYPEANLFAIISYTLANNKEKLVDKLNYTYDKFPNWSIPATWSMGIYLKNKKYNQAKEVLAEYFEHNLSPEPVLQNIYIGTLIRGNQLKLAKYYLEDQLIQNYPDNTLVNLGIISAIEKNYTDSLVNFTQAKVIDPQILNYAINIYIGLIYNYYAEMHNDKTKLSLAISYFTKSLNSNDPNINNLIQLLILRNYANLGNYKAVNSLLDKIAKDLKKNERDTLLFKAASYLDLGINNVAYDLLAKNYVKYKHDKVYILQYAISALLFNKIDLAIRLNKEYIKLDPQNAIGYNNLAFLYLEGKHDLIQAKKYALKAYNISPNNFAVLDTLGWVYYKEGNYNKALNLISKSVDANYTVEGAKHLKATLIALGRLDLANKVQIVDLNKKRSWQELMDSMLNLIMTFQYYGITTGLPNEK